MPPKWSTIFRKLPYNTIDNIRRFGHDAATFLRAPVGGGMDAVRTSKGLGFAFPQPTTMVKANFPAEKSTMYLKGRYLWNVRNNPTFLDDHYPAFRDKPWVFDPSDYLLTSGRKRDIHSPIYFNTDLIDGNFDLELTPSDPREGSVHETQKVFDRLKDLTTIDKYYPKGGYSFREWLFFNTSPGFALGSNTTIQPYAFPKSLSSSSPEKFIPQTLSHEWVHVLDGGSGVKPQDGIFDFSHLPNGVQNYFTKHDCTELRARGSQLKNYFGIIDNTPITGDMLKQAAHYYVPDTGMNNNMIQMFSGIRDWDKAADWFSQYSLKHGGILKRI